MNDEKIKDTGISFLYWLQSTRGLIGITDDDNPSFLSYRVIIGPAAGCRGRMSKHLADYRISQGHIKIITNPLEAFAIEVDQQKYEYKNHHLSN